MSQRSDALLFRVAVAIVACLLVGLFACDSVRAQSAAVPPSAHGAVPTPQQLAWHDRQFYAFVHFNMNTFTGREWGEGSESPSRFNPTQLDCRQWCGLLKECGLSGVIITAKHHDGFCLWPSRFTTHDVARSAWRGGKGDVIKELSEACREYGLWLGIYISPWDRNNPLYGKDDAAYNDYFAGQLEELLANYGPIAEVWWDGANGDRDNPERFQEYDWPRFIQTVRRLQPDAVIFAPPDTRGDLRWVGNEAGYAGTTQWSTYPAGTAEDPALQNVGVEGSATWMPAETDVSIRPGWYWTRASDKKVKSVDELIDIYYASVGRNTNLLLNFPVDERGLVPDVDASRLREVAAILRATFRKDYALGQKATATSVRNDSYQFSPVNLTDSNPLTYWTTNDDTLTATVEVMLDTPAIVDQVALQEYIKLGQRVRAWKFEARVAGNWRPITEGTTIGRKRIVRFRPVAVEAVRLNITDSRACPVIESLSLYTAPPAVQIVPAEPVFIERTTVELKADLPNCDIHYTLDQTEPTLESPRYVGPITVRESCMIRAVAAREGELSPRTASMQLVGYVKESLRAPVEPQSDVKPGLHVQKYAGGWQTLDQMAERKPVQSKECGNFDIGERLGNGQSALAFEGLLRVPTDGIYELWLESDDGARLYLGDELVVDNDGLHGTVEKSGHAGLRAGLHPIRVEWFNAGGGLELRVKWAGPGFEKQDVPSNALFSL